MIQWLAEVTLTTSIAAAVVAGLRRPLTRVAGAEVAYWLWLLIPIGALATVAPPLPSEIGGTSIFAHTLRSVVHIEAYSEQVARASVDYSVLATTAWIAGCAFMLALVAYRQLTFLRSLAGAKPLSENVYLSPAIHGPVLVGVLQPKIFLPIDFESKYATEDRALMLAHERAHLRRGDLLISAIATIWLCVFWFNPLMHWALARLRLDQELACDAAVVAASRTDRRRYADALLRTHLAADGSGRTPVACRWVSGHPLKERIMMLRRPLPSLSQRLCGAVLTGVFVLIGGCAVWSARPEYADIQANDAVLRGENSTIKADQATMDNGDLLFSGNVVITFDSNTARVSSANARFQQVAEGHYVVEALQDLRLSDDKVVITAAGGRVEKDGAKIVMTTERARISPVAPKSQD